MKGVDEVVLIPNDEWWIAEFYTNHPWITTYVNIGTPPIWIGDTVNHVDLDLDVVRKTDGSVAVMDEDEFTEHQAFYSYPPDLISEARQASDAVTEMLQHGEEPFGVAAETWIASVDPTMLL